MRKNAVKQCEVAGCENKHWSRGLCNGHQSTRYRKERMANPKPVTPRATGSDLYSTAHMRVKLARGLASQYPCIDCTGEAKDWSLNHDAFGIRQADNGHYVSDDPYDYDPRCKRCHNRYDRNTEWQVRDAA